MSKINIENKNSNEKVEIPIEIIEEVSFGDTINNSEEKKSLNIIYYVVGIILLIVCLMFLLDKPTIEELRIEQKNKASELLKNNIDLYNRYYNKTQSLSGEIKKNKDCIEKNSTVDLVYNCNIGK